MEGWYGRMNGYNNQNGRIVVSIVRSWSCLLFLTAASSSAAIPPGWSSASSVAVPPTGASESHNPDPRFAGVLTVDRNTNGYEDCGEDTTLPTTNTATATRTALTVISVICNEEEDGGSTSSSSSDSSSSSTCRQGCVVITRNIQGTKHDGSNDDDSNKADTVSVRLYETQWSDNSTAANFGPHYWQTQALLSDCLVVFVHGTPQRHHRPSRDASSPPRLLLPEAMTAALMRGWNQRAQAGLAPARILVVVTILPSSSAAFQQPLKQQTQLFEELRRRLVLNELNPLFATTTAFRLDSLDIIDAAEYPHYFSTSNNNGCSVTSLLQQSRGIQSILLLDDNDTNDDGNAESQPERVLASLMQQIYCAVGNRSAPDFSLVPQASGNDPSATIVINLSLQSIESPTAPSHHRVYDDEMPFSKSIPETMELCSEQTFDKYAASEESSSMQEISIIPIPDTDDHREETLQFEVPTQASTIIANPNEADKQVETMRRLRPQRAFARSGGFARVKNIIKLFPLNRFRQGTKATLDKPSFSIQSNGQPVTITVGNDEHEEILQILHDMLDTLRSHHDENLLDCERIPMDFATYAAPILTMLSSWPTCPQHESKAIQGQLIVFHQQHLGLLRDYYGKMFETMLDHYANDESLQIELKTRVVHNFKVAAERSIPQSQQVKSFVCKTDFNYDDALRGLQEDLNNAMELRKELISDDADTGNSMTRDRRRRFLQYCKMLASKGLMLGVNYLQGWLAWQGIKRSALERERNMPKFPLF